MYKNCFTYFLIEFYRRACVLKQFMWNIEADKGPVADFAECSKVTSTV